MRSWLLYICFNTATCTMNVGDTYSLKNLAVNIEDVNTDLAELFATLVTRGN